MPRGDSGNSGKGGGWGAGTGGDNAGWSLASCLSGAHGSSEFVTCCASPGGASGANEGWVATGGTDWSVSEADARSFYGRGIRSKGPSPVDVLVLVFRLGCLKEWWPKLFFAFWRRFLFVWFIVHVQVRLWDVVKSRELGRLSFRGHNHPVRCVAASSDGKLLVSGGEDHQVRSASGAR